MKIRSGFVSNSSSSSFLIYGVAIDESLIPKNFKEFDDCVVDESGEEVETYEISEELSDIFEKENLYFHEFEESGEKYIGISWGDIKDSETGAEFKERVKKSILKTFEENGWETKNLKFSTHEEAWRDG